MSTTKSDLSTANILVTGGAGFIGSWVAEHIAANNTAGTVVVIDKLSYSSSTKNLYEVIDRQNVHFVKGDVSNYDLVNELVVQFEISIILHFAGESSVDISFQQGIQFTQSNTIGTQTLLEVAKRHKSQIERILYFSTDEVYGEIGPDSPPVDESAALAPTNPYSASKAGADLIALSYFRSFDLPVIIARCCNVYGPRQYPEKLVSALAASMEGRREFTVHGDGSNTRCYIHISDVVSAVAAILVGGELGLVYNISTTDEISNLEMVQTICGSIDKPSATIKFGHDRPYNDKRYSMSFDRLTALGWERQKSLSEGLKETLQWYDLHSTEWWN